jgi:hypothetical protein
MAAIFIAHVEEDKLESTEIALALEQIGYTTWSYEVDSIPGPSYLFKTRQEIDKTKAFLIILSPDSLGSTQIESELVHAFEERKEIIPILKNITFAEFRNRRPDFAQIIGARTTITIPPSGTASILPRIIEGLRALSINPGPKPSPDRIKTLTVCLDDAKRSLKPEKKEIPEPASQETKTLTTAGEKPPTKSKKTWKFPPWMKVAVPALTWLLCLLLSFLPC